TGKTARPQRGCSKAEEEGLRRYCSISLSEMGSSPVVASAGALGAAGRSLFLGWMRQGGSRGLRGPPRRPGPAQGQPCCCVPGAELGEPWPEEFLTWESLSGESLSRELGPTESWPGDPLSREPLSRVSLSTEPLSRESLSTEPGPTEPWPGDPLSRESLPGESLPREPLSTELWRGEPVPGESLCREPLFEESSSTEPRPTEPWPGDPLSREEPLSGESWPGEPLSREPLSREPGRLRRGLTLFHHQKQDRGGQELLLPRCRQRLSCSFWPVLWE
uniref:Uncharacterized protein n=1 Tax=Catharus ustulatus TaxID=91951 RepID=A0A8C3U0J1_CATUS